MNKRIYNQLLKINPTIMPPFDEDTEEIFIKCPTGSEVIVDYVVGYRYRINLESYLLQDNANFSFHSNWNQGIVPKDLVMDVEVLQLMGKMVKVHGYGIDTNGDPNGNEWEGWLPKKSIRITAYY